VGSRSVGQWVSRSVGQWVSGSVVALGHDCMIAWMHGYPDTIGFVICCTAPALFLDRGIVIFFHLLNFYILPIDLLIY
jgi:hypothetical protein